MDGIITTPPLSDTILDGITRDSFLAMAMDLGYEVCERTISALELIELHGDGKLQEAFGVGTAAVTAPIKTIHILGNDYHLPETTSESFSQKAKKVLTEVRIGVRPDKYKWNTIVK
jgi:branched-chain amino acid aminotransferase